MRKTLLATAAFVLLPGLAAACAFDLPNLSFPDSSDPVTQGCAQPATLGDACPAGN